MCVYASLGVYKEVHYVTEERRRRRQPLSRPVRVNVVNVSPASPAVIPVSLLVDNSASLCTCAFCSGIMSFLPFHCWVVIPVSLLGEHSRLASHHPFHCWASTTGPVPRILTPVNIPDSKHVRKCSIFNS